MKTTPDIQELLSLEPELRRVALSSTRNADDADDVLQEMWLAVLRKRPGGVSSQRAWLGRMVRNLSASLARSESARRRRETSSSRDETVAATDAIVERTALRRHLLEHVLALEEPYRRVLLLRFVADMEPSDIAVYLGMPCSTVRVHCHRGLEKLRLRLRVDDPARRRAILAVLAPWLLPRRAWGRSALRLAAAATVIVATVVGLRSFEAEPTTPLESAPPAPRPAVTPPRRNPAPPPAELASDADRAGPAEASALPAAALEGVVSLLLDGEPHRGRLTLDVEVLGGEEDFARFMGSRSNDEDWRCGSPDVSVDVEAGAPFAIPLDRHGHCRVFIRAEGTGGGVIVYHSSRAPLERTVRLLPSVVILAPPGSTPRARLPVGVRSMPVDVTVDGPGEWCIEGPLFPGVEVTLDAATGPVLWQRIFEEEVSLRAVERLGRRRVRFIDAASGALLNAARVGFTAWTSDHRKLFAELGSDAGGEIELPVLLESDRRLGSRLWIDDASDIRWCIEPATRAILAAGADRERIDVRVGCPLRGSGTIAFEDGEPVAGADVFARLADGTALAGRTDASGRFTLTARGGAAAPRLVERGVMAVGTTEPPEAVSLEIMTADEVVTVDLVSWVLLERGEALSRIPRPSATPLGGAPAARRLRVVDEAGRPLPMVRVAISYPRSRLVHRGETDHGGVMPFPDLDPGSELGLSVLAPGRRLSLAHESVVPAEPLEPVLTTVPVRDVELSGSAFDGAAFVAIIVEGMRDSGRRHGFFGNTTKRTVPLNLEAQRVTVYTAGRMPAQLAWSPGNGLLHADAPRAAVVTLAAGDDVPDGALVLRARRIAVRLRHAGPLERVLDRFDVTGRREGSDIVFAGVSPGRYELCVVRGEDEERLSFVDVPGAKPLTISLEK